MTTASPARTNAPSDRDDLPCVHGQILFARRASDEKASAASAPGYTQALVSYDVPIQDARPIVEELSLDREGFTLIRHTTSCADVRDPEVMREKYLEEMVPFIKRYFNASWVVPRREGVILRTSGGSYDTAEKVRGPASTAHVDYAPVAGPVVAAMEDQLQGIKTRSYSRMMIIQAWRALSPPPQDFPLAICDNSTLVEGDICTHDWSPKQEPGYTFKSSTVRYDTAQRWYYFPKMAIDEVMLFKIYDSAIHFNSGAAHSSFDDRRAYPNAKPRESVEARFFVYFQ
jgi:hypothetical protein